MLFRSKMETETERVASFLDRRVREQEGKTELKEFLAKAGAFTGKVASDEISDTAKIELAAEAELEKQLMAKAITGKDVVGSLAYMRATLARERGVVLNLFSLVSFKKFLPC